MNNPYIHAGLATAYIGGIVGVMSLFERFLSDTPDTLLAPVAMLSLLVLSVCVMGYLFLYRPLILIMEAKHTEAFAFFIRTVGTFAVLTVVFVLLLLAGF